MSTSSVFLLIHSSLLALTLSELTLWPKISAKCSIMICLFFTSGFESSSPYAHLFVNHLYHTIYIYIILDLLSHWQLPQLSCWQTCRDFSMTLHLFFLFYPYIKDIIISLPGAWIAHCNADKLDKFDAGYPHVYCIQCLVLTTRCSEPNPMTQTWTRLTTPPVLLLQAEG